MKSFNEIIAEANEYELQEDLFESDNLSGLIEHVFQSLEQLEEAANFSEIPGEWKKIVAGAYNATGGENSKVVEIGKRNNLKSESLFRSTLLKALDGTKDIPGVWIEMNGKPMVLAVRTSSFTSSRPIYRIICSKGLLQTVSASRKINGTGEWSQRLKKFIPARYSKWEEPNLSKEDAQWRMYHVFKDIALEIAFEDANSPEINSQQKQDAFEKFILGADFVVKAIQSDSERAKKSAERKAAKSFKDPNIETRKAVFKKLVDSKMKEIVAGLNTVIPDATQVSKAIDAAFDGNREAGKLLTVGSIDAYKNKLEKVSGLVSRISELSRSDFKYADRRGWGADNNKELTYSASDFLKSLKEI